MLSNTTIEPFDSAGPTSSQALSMAVEIGPVGLVDRRRHGDDEDVAAAQVCGVTGELEVNRGKLVRADLVGRVNAFAKRRDAPRADVEPHDIMLARQGDRERKTDISKTDDSNVHASEPLLLAPVVMARR